LSWSPAQYLKFSQPRLRPALELLATVTGVDGSVDMLERASGAASNLQWLCQDIRAWRPARLISVLAA